MVMAVPAVHLPRRLLPTHMTALRPCCSKLYVLLHETAPVVGLWRLVGEGPRGALICFR